MARSYPLQGFNRKLVEDYFATISGATSDKPLEDYFSDDVVWYVPRSNPLVTPNPRRGLAEVLDLVGSGVDMYVPGSMAIDLRHLVADEHRVVAQFSFSALLCNGRDYESEYCFVFTIRGGRISEVWEYLDTLYQHQQGMFDGV